MSPLVALGLGLVLTPLLARLGRRVGLLDRPSDDELKIHAEAKPLTGGIAVVAATLVAVAVAGDGLDPLVAASIGFLLLVGVLDDARPLPPLLRLGAEFAAGGMLAAAGVTFAPLGDVLGAATVVVAVPVLANAVNVTDGQDGLVASLAGVAALGLWAVAAVDGAGPPLALALAAALAAFLVWNRPPARVFLGDGGAYGVGAMLVVLAAHASSSAGTLLGAIVCLGPFAFELGSTVLRRGFVGTMAGDRTHLYDLLARRLRGRERTTAARAAAAVIAAGLGWLCAELPAGGGVAVLVVVTVVGALAVRALWRSEGIRLRPLPERPAAGS
jgi:UDP-GlcNAc:undecaprenyl-phosphate GlcNAc-1-phosphate transferase